MNEAGDTTVYWIPRFELLSARDVEVRLVDPRQLTHVPGRKTDVLDCQGIHPLHSVGLLAAVFRPEGQSCVLRSSRFDAREPLHRLTGVDLTRIDGIDAPPALTGVAEIGLDMPRWSTEKHVATPTVRGRGGLGVLRASATRRR